MNIETQQLQDLNSEKLSTHKSQFDFLTQTLSKSNIDVNQVIQKLADFQVAIPSWALGAGGTRFGRFSYGGEPASLEQKIEDIGLIHKLTQTAGAVSLHIPWDVPEDYNAIKELAAINKIKFAMIGDPTGEITRNFDCMRETMGLADRATFVVDPEGIVQAMEITSEGIGRDADDLVRKVKAAQYVANNPGEVCPAKWKEGEETLAPSLDLVGKI